MQCYHCVSTKWQHRNSFRKGDTLRVMHWVLTFLGGGGGILFKCKHCLCSCKGWCHLKCRALTRTLQICRFFSPSFGGRMASAFSLVKSRSLYLVIGPMWQKFILLTIPHYSKIDWPLTLFCTRSPPFMSSDVIFLQAKWSKIKERVKGWKSGKKTWFKCITVCLSKISKSVTVFVSNSYPVSN